MAATEIQSTMTGFLAFSFAPPSALSESPEPSINDVAVRETAPGMGVAQVWLKPRKVRPFFGRHPWVLDTAIARIEGQAADCEVVDLISDKGRFVARGLFNSQSRIRVRLYSWSASEPLDDTFWRHRLETAIALRRDLGFTDPQGAARLVFSEADGISGLIVDRYGEYLAIQATALAMALRLDRLTPMLVELVRPRGIVLRNERGLAQNEGAHVPEGLHWGQMPDGPVFIEEHGLRYGVDLREGQKTGFYLDQRENRRVAAAYCRGRRVLDLFCYSGGFGLCALALGGAKEVLAVDGSQKALALARANAEINGVTNIRCQAGDGFQTLDALRTAGERFGVIVLDPPKFARSRAALDDALMAYHRLNRSAAELLESGGILITCSCSGHVTREDFLHMLAGVAQRSGRDIQVLEQRGAAPDHPVSASCLETEYLKCFICRVV
jgi:23S rRNA (cytosine1962-C5)-methyltransferase